MGFLALIIADIAQLKGKKTLFSALQIVGYFLVAACVGGMAVFNPSVDGVGLQIAPSAAEKIFAGKPVALDLIFIAFALIFGSLLVWSVFLEIPAALKRRAIAPGETYASGSYSLCRHPGFWWLAFFLLALGLYKNYSAYFVEISLIITLNLLLTYLQDHYIFPKVFRGYEEYRKAVPFLLPKL